MKRAALVAGGILLGLVVGFFSGAWLGSWNYERVIVRPAQLAQAGELVMLAEIAAAVREEENGVAVVVTEQMLTAGANGLPQWFPEEKGSLPVSARRAAESLNAYRTLYGEDFTLQPAVVTWVERHAAGSHEFLPECLRRYVEQNS